jgi:MFS transporter, DHA3 family, macrolide efflux protein
VYDLPQFSGSKRSQREKEQASVRNSETQPRMAGMGTFIFIWIGQAISMLGSGMTQFALTIWAYQTTGEATALALVGFFSYAPVVFVSPLAGALVDRWNRKLVMMLSDLAAGLSTIVVLILYSTGQLQIWHLCVTGAFAGIFGAFQFPAFSAAMSMMVPKEQYTRANGLVALAEAATGIVAPILAGLLLTVIGISGVMLIDIVTFVFAVSAVALVFIPQPPESEAGREGRGSLWRESIYGFQYIWARKSLLGIQLTFTISNFFFAIGMVLVAPMILARTGNNELALGTIQSFMGVGGVVGAVLLSTWGGPRRRIHGVLGGFIIGSLFGQSVMGMGQSLPVWALAAFGSMVVLPFINGSNQSIWQAKVAPDVQGRVFATRRLIAQVSGPLGMLIGGPLADRIFEPAMRSGGSLVPVFGWLVGVGPGAGMGLILVLVGILGAMAGVVGYSVPAIRDLETIMPDHDSAPIMAPAVLAEAG